MAKATHLFIVLWFSFRILAPQSVIAQIERDQAAPHKPEEQHSRSQTGISPQQKKATLSSEPENVSPEAVREADDLDRILQIGGHVNLGPTETADSIVLFAGDAKIQGSVRGDIFVLSGDAEIREGARVLGKVTVVMGEIIGKEYLSDNARNMAEPYKEIRGQKLIPAAVSLMMQGVPQEVWGARKHGWFWKLMIFVTLTFTHMLLVVVFSQRMDGMAYTISRRPIGNTLLGLIVLIIIPYLAMLLILSIVGIPLMLLFCAILLLMAIYGKTAIFLSIGNTIFPQQSNIVAVVIGYWIYRMATFIPYINFVTFIIASTIGIGVCIRTVFGQKTIRPTKGYQGQSPRPTYRGL